MLHFHLKGAEVLKAMWKSYSIPICKFDMAHLAGGLEADLRTNRRRFDGWLKGTLALTDHSWPCSMNFS